MAQTLADGRLQAHRLSSLIRQPTTEKSCPPAACIQQCSETQRRGVQLAAPATHHITSHVYIVYALVT